MKTSALLLLPMLLFTSHVPKTVVSQPVHEEKHIPFLEVSNTTCNIHGIMPAFIPMLKPLPQLSIQGNQFSNAFQFRGINWFGFNNKQTMVDGLWIGGSSMATDFNTIVYRLKLLGFNSVRLPFQFEDLEISPALGKKVQCTPPETVAGITSTTVTPGDRNPSQTPPLFNGHLILKGKNVCNDYLEDASTLKRFMQVVRTFINNGFYVVVDYHPTAVSPYAYNVKEFTKKWAALAMYIKSTPDYESLLKGRILYDIMNEPDFLQLKWSAAHGKPGVKDYYLAVMDALFKILGKDALFMVEGAGQVAFNLNWGDGFVSNPDIANQYGIMSAQPFFSALLKKPYVNQVIISPHMYGPSISLNNRAHKGEILFKRMDESFGYLYEPGYCEGKTCKKFPIILGEFGSFFVSQDDLDHLRDLASYMKKRFAGSMNWMYWAYNNNSGDTGGIVKQNWLDFEWKKLQWLQQNMKLTPWYR